MAKKSSKSNVVILIVVGLVVFTAVATYLFTRTKYENNSISIDKIQANSCKTNSKGDLTSILKPYEVKSGDSLLSIAKNELGDVSRYQEIAVMNGDKYPVIFSSPGVVSKNPFLEQGWILLLPPSWIKSSSGQLDIVNGMVFAIDPVDNALMITINTDKSGWSATLKTDTNSINSQNTNFKVGDCITAVRDIRLNRVIKIDLQ